MLAAVGQAEAIPLHERTLDSGMLLAVSRLLLALIVTSDMNRLVIQLIHTRPVLRAPMARRTGSSAMAMIVGTQRTAGHHRTRFRVPYVALNPRADRNPMTSAVSDADRWADWTTWAKALEELATLVLERKLARGSTVRASRQPRRPAVSELPEPWPANRLGLYGDGLPLP